MKRPAVRRHHRLALAAVLLGVALGVAFGYADHVGPAAGLYFALTTASTTGYGDITPHGWLPHLLASVLMLAVIPLLAAAWASLAAFHLHRHVRDHIDRALAARGTEDHNGGKAP